MLSLSTKDIQLKQSAIDKQEAIKAIAAGLEQQGLVETGYVRGMLDREAQNSTFLGNGIAIPHGTTDTRDLVKETGVRVHHFPQGVSWGDGKTVYLAIGIAAKSDEHLGILKQLTKVLSADGVEEKLKTSDSAEGLIAILNGEAQLEADFDESYIQLTFPATDLVQLTAVAAGLVKNHQSASNETVADAIASGATHLGQGLWVAKSSKGVSRTALSFVTPATSIEEAGFPVKGLLFVAACNGAHINNMNYLAQLLFTNQAGKLFTSTAEQVVTLLTEEALDGNTDVFKIRNPHGLHARPGAMLVSVAKKFNSNILVSNLNSEGKAVNAKSLMKVIALGVKQGHELQFTAKGDDADEALVAIGQAIADGLGEGK
ncbi:fused PTS fructose transporter subunit IIA/HPr protein [Photobacterium lutimaris]|uniref:Multiphosphoryl transfer protein n=1 Tax=Photobacterium lutimaris TaxID=388278 RepID=A0A2T3J081_9GAMM|nr:fused PTS fructose transporter subunit IIA/HPr protein [Photobacterium lutimaris]PSU34356.1 bifunctional PTS fructose transporter subunit IIA/HPr protein [Photobacterium lutimaris]TDR75952.1 phosphocarrier protein HPr /PTS system D-fructose-specific IIA component (F1P-forming) (Frc family) [Photobacterium lutimaris]